MILRLTILAILISVLLAACAHKLGTIGDGSEHPRDLKADKLKVEDVVDSHLGEMNDCYKEELKTSPGIDGRVTLQWAIGAHGDVVWDSVKANTMGVLSSDFQKCLLDTLKSWKFPEPKGPFVVTVSHPFTFNARN